MVDNRGKGQRLVLARVKHMFAQSGLSIQTVRELLTSRSGRKRLTDLVYRGVREHYQHNGKSLADACQSARIARVNFRKRLKLEAAVLYRLNAYATNPLGVPVKDTSRPTDSFYVDVTPRKVSMSPIPFCWKLPPTVKPVAVIVKAVNVNDKVQYQTVSILANDTEAPRVTAILNK